MKILVVDDSQVDQMIVKHHLQTMKHEVVIAENGEQAIQYFKDYDPDLVLLDLRLPDIDGFQVVKKMREVEKDWRPILFLSSSVDIESFSQGIYAGADDFLHKPVDQAVLDAKLHAMERLLDMRKQLLNVSLALAKETEKAKKMANQDGLTGIANRRFLDSILEKEFRRHQRSGKVLSIIMIDIDFFKSFNDFYGHLAGDDALRLCAQTMAEMVSRAGDLAARFGGEEFCIVLPNTDVEGAKKIAEVLRKKIEQLHIAREDVEQSNYLTVSLGVNGWVPGESNSINQLLTDADKALYKAKQQGRNQVCVAGDAGVQYSESWVI